MTSFQRPAVHACPGCGGFLLRDRLRTINFFGMRDWSDGAPTVWWSRCLQPLVRCDACAALFWIDDLDALGELPHQPRPIGRLARAWARLRGDRDGILAAEQQWLQTPAGWKTAQRCGSAGLDDVLYVLAHPAGLSHERLVWLRKTVWHTLNDRYRNDAAGAEETEPAPLTLAAERENKEALLGLLHSAPGTSRDMLACGELLRQLGRFDEAVAVLRAVPADGHSECRAVKIEALARSGDPILRPLGEQTW